MRSTLRLQLLSLALFEHDGQEDMAGEDAALAQQLRIALADQLDAPLAATAESRRAAS